MAEPSTHKMAQPDSLVPTGTSVKTDDREKGLESLTGYRTQCLPTSCIASTIPKHGPMVNTNSRTGKPQLTVRRTMNNDVPTPKAKCMEDKHSELGLL